RVGGIVSDLRPEALAGFIRATFSDPGRIRTWKENAQLAADELNWDQEKTRLLDIIEHAR
ncbi:MAG: hypothetical protein KBA16_08025, partial [Bacteroidia bacterium]|nr:hypothetical protein [Bacteroidia bacterium]